MARKRRHEPVTTSSSIETTSDDSNTAVSQPSRKKRLYKKVPVLSPLEKIQRRHAHRLHQADDENARDSWGLIADHVDEETLRPIQAEALQLMTSWYDKGSWKTGQRLLLIIPTGGGKARILALCPAKCRVQGIVEVSCRWREINASNASVFLGTRNNDLEEPDDLPSLMSHTGSLFASKEDVQQLASLKIAGQKTINKKSIITYVGAEIQMNTPVDRLVAMSLNDECQNNPIGYLDREFAKVHIHTSAYPSAEYLNPSKFHIIEFTTKRLVDINGIKRPHLMRVPDTLKVTSAKALNDIYSGSDESRGHRSAEALIIAALEKRDVLIAKSNSDRCVGGIKPGIVVRVPTIEAGRGLVRDIHSAVRAGRLPHDIKAAAVNSIDTKTGSKELKRIKKVYKRGNLDIIVLCQMLAVGWHEARTAITVAMCGMNFRDTIQFMGRAASKHELYTDSWFIAHKSFYDVTNFYPQYRVYALQGVTHMREKPSSTGWERSDDADDVCDPTGNLWDPITINMRHIPDTDELPVWESTPDSDSDAAVPCSRENPFPQSQSANGDLHDDDDSHSDAYSIASSDSDSAISNSTIRSLSDCTSDVEPRVGPAEMVVETPQHKIEKLCESLITKQVDWPIAEITLSVNSELTHNAILAVLRDTVGDAVFPSEYVHYILLKYRRRYINANSVKSVLSGCPFVTTDGNNHWHFCEPAVKNRKIKDKAKMPSENSTTTLSTAPSLCKRGGLLQGQVAPLFKVETLDGYKEGRKLIDELTPERRATLHAQLREMK